MFSNVLLVLSRAFVKDKETAMHIHTYVFTCSLNKSIKQLNTEATDNFPIATQKVQGQTEYQMGEPRCG